MQNHDHHGVFLPASYKNTFRFHNLADMETVQVPAIASSRFLLLRMIAVLAFFTIVFVVALLWFLAVTSSGLGGIILGAILYSFVCAWLVKLLAAPPSKSESFKQFSGLKEDTMSYLRAIRRHA